MTAIWKWLLTHVLEWLFTKVKGYYEEYMRAKKERDEKATQLKQATEELKNAQTDEELFNAQEKIVKLKSP